MMISAGWYYALEGDQRVRDEADRQNRSNQQRVGDADECSTMEPHRYGDRSMISPSRSLRKLPRD